MTKLIYAYIKKDTNEYKYIGQTNNLSIRIKKHNDYDPYNPNNPEYNYPLSRAIRKYGKDAFEIVILENNLTEEQAAEREKYWIEKYNTCHNGYNQTFGGEIWGYSKFSYELINQAKKMIKEGIPFKEISLVTGISIVHLSQINHGTRHYDSAENYPLYEKTRGAKVTKLQVLEIIDLLKSTKMSKAAIGKKYGISASAISSINIGRTHRINNIEYPIRK